MSRDAELNGEVFTFQTAHDEVHVFWSLLVAPGDGRPKRPVALARAIQA